MSIIFTLIYSINEEKEITSFSPLTGEFKDPSIRIARKIQLNKRGTYATKDEGNFFHYINCENICFLTLTQKKGIQSFVFEYLDEIKGIFMSMFSSMIDNPYNDYRTYEDIIKKKMEEYNINSTQSDKIETLKNAVYSYKDEVLKVNDVLDERNERLLSVNYKADNLKNESISVFKLAKKVNQKSKSNNCKIYVGIVIIILLIVVGLFFGICGLELQCFRNNKNSTSTCEFKEEKIKKNKKDEIIYLKNKTFFQDNFLAKPYLNKTN